MYGIREIICSLGAYCIMVLEVGRDIFRHGVEPKELIRQIVRIGSASVPIVLLTAVFTGMVLALQTAYGLQRFGAKNYVGNVVSLAVTRELGPVLTALMLCGRVGAGIAAEIASMVATEQVDAMRALGANPIRKLVSPRVVAAVIALPALVIMADIIGMYGGVLVAVYELNITAHTYYESIKYTILIRDVIDGLIKSSIFGFLLVTIACYKALNTRGGTEGVGLTTTAAVVISSVVIFVSDFFLTKLLIALG
ncbi:MAG: ABC transporter permease [Candidatus Dadabacteria bacterium]|nr:MAG: ABC transporter permease [Candidatus Dadabacteria bacterium]